MDVAGQGGGLCVVVQRNEFLGRASIELEDRTRQAPAMVFGISENEQANQRMRLMEALGGCSLRIDSAELAADATFRSTWVMVARVAPQAAARLGQFLTGGRRDGEGGTAQTPGCRDLCGQ